jgi:hypothetical protein
MRTPSSLINLFQEIIDGLAVGNTSAAQTYASSVGGTKKQKLGGNKYGLWKLTNVLLLRQFGVKEINFLSGLFPSGFLTNNLYAFPLSPATETTKFVCLFVYHKT